MIPLSFALIRATFERLRYPFLEVGNFNLNLVGIRCRAANQHDHFDDALAALFYQEGRPVMITMRATTDPGRYWLQNPLTERGTAILKPGHYRHMWSIGLHKGLYPALVQSGVTTVYRDSNADPHQDTHDVAQETGRFGINCHRAAESYIPSHVDRWSAGCQVVQNSHDFELLLALCRRAATAWGSTFAYTLLTEDQLWTPSR